MPPEIVIFGSLSLLLAVYVARYRRAWRKFKHDMHLIDAKTHQQLFECLERQAERLRELQVKETANLVETLASTPLSPGATEAADLFQMGRPHFVPNSEAIWFPLHPEPGDSLLILIPTGGPH